MIRAWDLEKRSLAPFFPRDPPNQIPRGKQSTVFIPPVYSLLQMPLIWHFDHLLSTFFFLFLNHFKAIFAYGKLEMKSWPLFVNRRKPAVPVRNPTRQLRDKTRWRVKGF